MPTLRIHGPAQLALDDGGALALSAREAALLAWLHLQGPTTRAQLAGLLWPLGDDAKARANLRQTLARLRRAAGDVLTEADGVLRLAAGVTLDANATGELLAGLHFDDAPELADWLAARRDDARRGRQRERLADAQARLAEGDLDGALALADAVLADEPESEQAWRIRMEALDLGGDRAAAIAAWDECREALRRAFGVAPSPETNALGKRILARAQGLAAGPAPRAQPADTLPPALRRPPQLVGRVAVLAEIERSLHLRHAVVIAGPGGIGKSRLLGELVAAHAPALRVAARPGDRVLPGAAFARLLNAALQRFVPVLDEATRSALAVLLPEAGQAPAALTSSLEHRRVLQSAARALQACAERGLRVLVFDDLQHADDASISALQVLIGAWLASEEDDAGSAAPRAALLPVFGVRDAELSPAGVALLDLLAGSRRSARFNLAPLTRDDVLALLGALPLPEGAPAPNVLADALLAQVGGNPAYLLESLKSLWLDGLDRWQHGSALPVPPSLRDSVRQRLEQLPSDAMQLAQLAAVAGRDFSLSLAASSLGRAPLALAPVLGRLQAAQVFDGHGLAHDLVAEAITQSLPPMLAASLHRLVAEHLIGQGGAPASIAHHLDAAGEQQAAGPWHRQAGERAVAQWQWLEAARSFEAAARVIDPLRERAAAFRAWHGAGRGWLMTGRNDESLRCLAQAEALARTPVERLLVLNRKATALNNAERYGESAAIAREVARQVPAVVDSVDDDDLAQIMTCVSLSLGYVSEPGDVFPLCEALRPRGRRSPRLAARVEQAQGSALTWLARPRESWLLMRAALDSVAGSAVQAEAVNVGNQLLRASELMGDAAQAAQEAEETRRLVREAGLGPLYEADLQHHQGLLLIAAGQPGPGLLAMQTADALPGGGARHGVYHALRAATVHLLFGAPEQARARLLAVEPATSALVSRGFWCWLQARLAADAGEPWQHWLDEAAGCCTCAHGMMALRQQVIALALAPRPPEGATAELIGQLQARSLFGLQRIAHVAAARGSLAAGDTATAVQQAQAALALTRWVDPWFDNPADVWLQVGGIMQRAGRQAAAVQAFADGAGWVQRAASTIDRTEARNQWCEANPVHRALLARTA